MAATQSLARNPGTSRAIFAPRRRWPDLVLSVASRANSMPSSSQSMITAPSNPRASPVSRSRERGVSSPSTDRAQVQPPGDEVAAEQHGQRQAGRRRQREQIF